MAYLFNGSHLAHEHNVVIAATNYRLGALGFMAFQSQSKAQATTGNWGILDQQSAMRWIKREIPAFGGDPDRIMIFGESAGAISTVLHLTLHGSNGLFSRGAHVWLLLLSSPAADAHVSSAALSESGFASATTLSAELPVHLKFAELAGCTANGTLEVLCA